MAVQKREKLIEMQLVTVLLLITVEVYSQATVNKILTNE